MIYYYCNLIFLSFFDFSEEEEEEEDAFDLSFFSLWLDFLSGEDDLVLLRFTSLSFSSSLLFFACQCHRHTITPTHACISHKSTHIIS